MSERYELGSAVTLSAPVTDLAGTPVDPTTITSTVQTPDGDRRTFTTETAPPVIRDGVGLYHLDYQPEQVGEHLVVWQTTGPGQAVGVDAFTVTDPFLPRLVSIDDLRTHVFGPAASDEHDDELAELADSATEVVERIAGAVLPRTVVETLRTDSTTVILSRFPVTAVTSVVSPADVPVTGWTVTPGGVLTGTGLDGVTVTYTVGRAVPTATARRAVKRWVSWAWARDHSGSETYQPAGTDGTFTVGPAGIEKELRLLLLGAGGQVG